VYRKGSLSLAIPGVGEGHKGSPSRAWDGVGWAGAHHEGAF